MAIKTIYTAPLAEAIYFANGDEDLLSAGGGAGGVELPDEDWGGTGGSIELPDDNW